MKGSAQQERLPSKTLTSWHGCNFLGQSNSAFIPAHKQCIPATHTDTSASPQRNRKKCIFNATRLASAGVCAAACEDQAHRFLIVIVEPMCCSMPGSWALLCGLGGGGGGVGVGSASSHQGGGGGTLSRKKRWQGVLGRGLEVGYLLPRHT